MSTMLIAVLVVAGLAVIIGIGFLGQALERARLQKSRIVADLQARWNYCHGIRTGLPGQFMTSELNKLLLTIEVNLLTRLLKQEPNNARHGEQLSTLQHQLEQHESFEGKTALAICDEATAQQLRKQLSDLLRLLDSARQEGVLEADESFQRCFTNIRRQRVDVVLQMHRVLADAAMKVGKPRVAKLQYERAIAYLSQKGMGAYAEQLKAFRQLLLQAERAAVQQEQAVPGTELSSGIQALEEDDQAWRKKALYDD